MAKLSKEVRSIVSSKTRAAKARVVEGASVERLVLTGTAPVGAAAAAAVDAYGPKVIGEVAKVGPIPVNLIAGGVLTAGGMLLGKGAVAAGAAGTGVGLVCAAGYRALNDMMVEHREEKAAKADDDD